MNETTVAITFTDSQVENLLTYKADAFTPKPASGKGQQSAVRRWTSDQAAVRAACDGWITEAIVQSEGEDIADCWRIVARMLDVHAPHVHLSEPERIYIALSDGKPRSYIDLLDELDLGASPSQVEKILGAVTSTQYWKKGTRARVQYCESPDHPGSDWTKCEAAKTRNRA